MFALSLSHLEYLSVLGYMEELENERDHTSHMLSTHLYDHFKGDLRCLPPTEDALIQHVLRASIQITITKSAHLYQHNILDPTEYGQYVTNNTNPYNDAKISNAHSSYYKSHFCNGKKGKCLRSFSSGNRNI